jgi:hypothetical protein
LVGVCLFWRVVCFGCVDVWCGVLCVSSGVCGVLVLVGSPPVCIRVYICRSVTNWARWGGGEVVVGGGGEMGSEAGKPSTGEVGGEAGKTNMHTYRKHPKQ